jgi:hypothetical protein
MRIGTAGSPRTRSGACAPRAVRCDALEQAVVSGAGSKAAGIAAAALEVIPAMIGFRRRVEPDGGCLSSQASPRA